MVVATGCICQNVHLGSNTALHVMQQSSRAQIWLWSCFRSIVRLLHSATLCLLLHVLAEELDGGNSGRLTGLNMCGSCSVPWAVCHAADVCCFCLLFPVYILCSG
jgi:hypothetical protein